MQAIAYDARGEYVARRSVPVREDTPESDLLFDLYEHDALGREVLHTMPWGAQVQTAYDGLSVRVTDARGEVTVAEHDALGRPVTITDAAKGVTRYTYGPFGWLATVTDPGNAVTYFQRDALGRVRRLDDPDRGTTSSKQDWFGELLTSTDGVVLVYTFD